MSEAIALTPGTFDRFDRAASRVLGTDNGGAGGPLSDSGTFHLLRVASSTIGTYGYPAKIQQFDPSDGSFADSAVAPATVYLVDPTGAALRADERYDAKFVGFRGAAGEAVYEAVAARPIGDNTFAPSIRIGDSYPVGPPDNYVEIEQLTGGGVFFRTSAGQVDFTEHDDTPGVVVAGGFAHRSSSGGSASYGMDGYVGAGGTYCLGGLVISHNPALDAYDGGTW